MTQKMNRKRLVGKVISNQMMATVVVEMTRLVRHPVYPRVIRQVKRVKAHDAVLKLRVGDEVRIEETRPISKDKRWRVVEVVRRAPEGVGEVPS